MNQTKVKSIFNPEFLHSLEQLSPTTIKMKMIQLLDTHDIKKSDKDKIKISLIKMNTYKELLMYCYNLNLKFEGYGVRS